MRSPELATRENALGGHYAGVKQPDTYTSTLA